VIYRISRSDLEPDFLHEIIYPNLEQTLYWSDEWDPEFYVALARAGFISISFQDPDRGPLLLPELQDRYAVLDWENLHLSRRIRKLRRSGRLEEEGIELRVVDACERVIDRLLDHHGQRTSWLTEPYCRLIARLPTGGDVDFSIQGVELWSTGRNRLVAGELGYTIGRTYTSLSGFCAPGDPAWRGFGTLQTVMLAELLMERGYSFWNLGHWKQAYKLELGARVLERRDFLARWLTARDEPADRLAESR